MNEFLVVFELEFMIIYLFVIIGIFFIILVLLFEKYKFIIVGKVLIGMCFIFLFVLFVYIWVGGIFLEINELIMSFIGFFSVLFFIIYLYIFLIFVILFGGEKKLLYVFKFKK